MNCLEHFPLGKHYTVLTGLTQSISNSIMKSNLATALVGKNVCQVAQNVCLKMYVKTGPGTGTHRVCMSPGMYTCYILCLNYLLYTY